MCISLAGIDFDTKVLYSRFHYLLLQLWWQVSPFVQSFTVKLEPVFRAEHTLAIGAREETSLLVNRFNVFSQQTCNSEPGLATVTMVIFFHRSMDGSHVKVQIPFGLKCLPT